MLRAIADKFLAGAFWAIGHEAIIFRKSRAGSGTRARPSTLRTEAHLETHGREAGGALGRPRRDGRDHRSRTGRGMSQKMAACRAALSTLAAPRSTTRS